jgi:MFS family permease
MPYTRIYNGINNICQNINSNKKPPFNLAFIIKGFKEHFTYLWKYPKAGKTIAMISYFWVFGSILLIYFPVIVKDVLHANSDTSTILLALYCIGIGTGSLLCEHFSYGQIKQSFILQGLLGLGISCCLFAFGFPDDNPIVSQRSLAIMGVMEMIHNYPLMLSSLILMGVSSGFFTVPLYTALQKDAPEHIRGGIIATNNMMNSLLMIIGVVLFQQIAKHFDLKLQGILYINGLIPIVLWLFILAKNSKKLLTV